MTCIYLVRHGQASFDADDYDNLSSVGEQQAQVLGQDLARRELGFQRCWHGSMLRQQQTFQALKLAYGAQLADAGVVPGWNEFDHHDVLGAFDPQLSTASSMREYLLSCERPQQVFGELFTQAIVRWQSGHNDADYREAWPEFADRAQRTLQHAAEQLGPGENGLVITSGGVIALLVAALMGVPHSHWFKINWTLVNAGVTKVICGKGRFMIASVNEHQHFDSREQRALITYK